jgi:hypothetical protein
MTRVGSIVLATDQGLGVLARSFYTAGVVTDILVVRHSSRPTNESWYPGAKIISASDRQAMREFVRQLDVFLAFELPWDWSLFPFCREQGVRSALMPMVECMPKVLPSQPDLFLCPSLLDLQYYPERSVFIPVPVSVPWRLRERAEVFVHNAGHGGLKGRNGTAELIEAWKLVKSPARLILRSQDPLPWKFSDHRIDLRVGTVSHEELWTEGDAFVFCDRFDGLSLPLQEARASGMLVISGDRFPSNTWLPREPLVPVARYTRSCVSPRCLEFDEAHFDPETIAATIDAWYGRDFSEYSQSGRAWAEENSWDRLKGRYIEALLP